MRNIFDPTAGRENTSSAARETISPRSDDLYVSARLVAALKAGRLRRTLLTTFWSFLDGGKSTSKGRSIGFSGGGGIVGSSSVKTSLATPLSSLATTLPTLEKPHRWGNGSADALIAGHTWDRRRQHGEKMNVTHLSPADGGKPTESVLVDEQDVSLLRFIALRYSESATPSREGLPALRRRTRRCL
jgi:hypothetical protein